MSVYLIQVGESGNVKIGLSAQPESRLAALQTSHYEALHLRAIIEGENEKLLHKRFARLRIRGEWFLNEEPLTSFVKCLPPASKAYRPDPWPFRHSIWTMQYFWFHDEMPSDEEASDRLETPVRTLYRLFGPSGRPSGWKRRND